MIFGWKNTNIISVFFIFCSYFHLNFNKSFLPDKMILKVLHLMLLLPVVCDSISWHEGCLCELTNPNTLSLEQNKIFDTQHFRHGRKISQFCPCSISSIQKLNEVHISPTLGALLSTPFFRSTTSDSEIISGARPKFPKP